MKQQINQNWKTLQNNWPTIFKGVKVIKVKERLRYCSILKATKDTWQGIAKYDSGLDPFAIKDITGTTCKPE